MSIIIVYLESCNGRKEEGFIILILPVYLFSYRKGFVIITVFSSCSSVTKNSQGSPKGTYIKDGGSPDARLRLACLSLARLRLNDRAKLWVSFKLCFKTNHFYHTYRKNIL